VQEIVYPPKCPDRVWGPPRLAIERIPVFSGVKTTKRLEVDYHLYIVPRSRISGAIRQLIPSDFIIWIETVLLLQL
jgi:hypothetical protein